MQLYRSLQKLCWHREIGVLVRKRIEFEAAEGARRRRQIRIQASHLAAPPREDAVSLGSIAPEICLRNSGIGLFSRI